MALKIHTDYGYSFDNLKVLQGGWHLWEERSTTDAQGYPIDKK
ncbi:MAG TPA: hypothetical protein VM409_02060 [Chloroflexia bacterium]|nr:hypothetical protein [Chloroflexia bacterium]